MQTSAYAIGQAVFTRTDTPDFREEVIPFKSLEKMVQICSKAHEGLILEKVIIYSMCDQEPCALTLGFISASRGQRPGQTASPAEFH
ncbi:MAG: hypothetical protein ACO1QB_15440 [Verrucomicrobiales bacterium]